MTSDARIDVLPTLVAWREQGLDRADPIRFQLIEALARRANQQNGPARTLMDQKLTALISAFEATVQCSANAAIRQETPALRQTKRVDDIGPLSQLLQDIVARRTDSKADASSELAQLKAAYPELPLIDTFRDIWSAVSANRHVQQSEKHVPDNAGPLNSSHLVHRSLSLMRTLSPGYLRHFLSYVDALSWLEQIPAANGPSTKDAARPGAAAKSTRTRARQ